MSNAFKRYRKAAPSPPSTLWPVQAAAARWLTAPTGFRETPTSESPGSPSSRKLLIPSQTCVEFGSVQTRANLVELVGIRKTYYSYSISTVDVYRFDPRRYILVRYDSLKLFA